MCYGPWLCNIYRYIDSYISHSGGQIHVQYRSTLACCTSKRGIYTLVSSLFLYVQLLIDFIYTLPNIRMNTGRKKTHTIATTTLTMPHAFSQRVVFAWNDSIFSHSHTNKLTPKSHFRLQITSSFFLHGNGSQVIVQILVLELVKTEVPFQRYTERMYNIKSTVKYMQKTFSIFFVLTTHKRPVTICTERA